MRMIVAAALAGGTGFTGAAGAQNDLPIPIGTVHVLAIGVEEYEHTSIFGDLKFAEEDATVFAELMDRRFGYKTTLLPDKLATRDAVYAAIERLRREVGENDAVIFFFAGHGSTEKRLTSDGLYEGFMIPYIEPAVLEAATIPSPEPAAAEGASAEAPVDSPEPEDPGADDPGVGVSGDGGSAAEAAAPGADASEGGGDAPAGDAEAAVPSLQAELALQTAQKKAYREAILEQSLPMVGVRDRLTSLDCRHVVMIIDACFAGLANARSGGLPEPGGGTALVLSRYFDALDDSRIVLTAGTGGQVALEYDGPEAAGGGGDPTHGVFTYELLEILRAVDATGLSVPELHTLAKPRVRQAALQLRGIRAANADRTLLMTPQLRDFSEVTGASGSFVFIPKPEEDWRERVKAAIRETATARREGGAGRGENDDQLLDTLYRESRESAEQAAARAKLESKAMVALAYRASQGRSMGDDALQDDEIWSPRFEETLDKASTGDPDAMAAMYYMYAFGLGTAPDEREAARWASEAASSDSGDAQQAFHDALEARIGLEAAEQAEADAVARSLEQSQQDQAQLAAIGTVVAVTQLSGNEGLGNAGLAVGGVALAAKLFERLQNVPEASIQMQIIRVSEDMDRLGEEMRNWKRNGRADKAVFNDVNQRLPGVIKDIITTAKSEQRNAPDESVLEFTRLAGRDAQTELVKLGKHWRSSNPRARNVAIRHFDELERAFGELLALLPYIEYSANWNEG